MRIVLHHRARECGADGVAAELPPGDEELLIRREPVDRGQRWFATLRDLECAVRDPRPGQIADALAQHELAVVVDPRLDEVAVELLDDAGRALVEARSGRLGVHQFCRRPCASNCAP